MSTGHLLTPAERIIWQKRIKHICTDLYAYNDYTTLCYFIVQLYEYCVACESKDEHSPIKLKLLQTALDNKAWVRYCKDLYLVRGEVTHAMYKLDINFTLVFDNPLYNILVDKYFDEEYRVYLQVIRSSYQTCLQEDYLL